MIADALSRNPVPTCSNVIAESEPIESEHFKKRNPCKVKESVSMNVGELALSEPANACESAALHVYEPANACESAAIPEPANTCESALSEPILSNSSVSSVSTGTCDEDGSPSITADGGSEPPSPASSSVDELQTLPVVEATCVSEIAEQQRRDSELSPIIKYLEDGTIPTEKKLARRLVMERSRFDIIDGVLYYENPDVEGKWQIAVPTCWRETLIKEAHNGRFGGHSAERRIYEQLRKYYWWDKMRADIRHYCRACLVCASRTGQGRALKPQLQPIPIGGPFHRVGVDVLQLPLTYEGNQYAIVFMDYLTKWPEVFPSPDQKAETIARLLVEHVVARHGVPEQLLSDRGTNFLSEVIQEVCTLLGVEKVNTSGYHPQTDGLVERFNRTIIAMLSKCVKKHGRDWDTHLPYLLFAYRVSVQESTRESPFFLLYGRDPRLPTETAVSHPTTPYQVDISDYRTELIAQLSDAWETAHQNIHIAQRKQKQQYDKRSKDVKLKVGDRVMVHMKGTIKGKAWKFSRPYHGPYRVVTVTGSNAEVRLVDDPAADSIFVSLDRVKPCYPELPDISWTGHTKRKAHKNKDSKEQDNRSSKNQEEAREPYIGPITRSRSKQLNSIS